MGWTEVDEYLRVNDLHYISGGEEDKKDLVRKAVQREFPDLSSEKIRKAIQGCLKDREDQDPRQIFLDRLENRLSAD